MRFISTHTHALLDYAGATFLLAGPFLFYSPTSWALWIPVFVGLVILFQSLFTKYELSFGQIIPMSAHLAIDFVAGVLLLVSPWMFGFENQAIWPHVLVGLALMGGALTTTLESDQTFASPQPKLHSHS